MSEPVNRQILDEASAWFVEFRVGSPTERTREQFMQWLRRSPDHIRAYLEISRTYVQLPGEGAVSDIETARLLEKARARLENEVVPLETSASRLPLPRSREPQAMRLDRRLAALAALGLVGLIGAISIWSMTQRGLYTTEAGEQRNVMLADGSRIGLNGRTRLRVAYSSHERDVKLFEGQALFQVAKDKSRPFVVDSGSAQIRAVGTAFDVHRQGAETTVTVLEGTVAVLSSSPIPASAAEAVASANIMVTAGEQAVITPQGSSNPHATNVSAATAWTRGQLEFDETPLSQVAEQFNRSSPRPLILDSQNVGRVRISGIYSSVDPASLILFLRNQPDLEVTEAEDKIQVHLISP